MDDTKVEKSSISASPDLEKYPRQTRHSQQPQIPQQKVGAKRKQEWAMENGEKQDQALYQPIWWWFTSTAFPLIAGSFGPIASLFSICALIDPWRIDSVNKSHVPDPPWLTTLNSCSLALAIVANIILSFNFARRIRYSLAQPLTISLWYLSCMFLIIPISLTSLPSLSPSKNPNLAYSESFYYAVISAALYFTVSTLLLLNVIGASRFFRAYPPTFAVLTLPQRTLMLQSMLLSVYFALGAGVFSAIEGWAFTDGLYWADYTVLTIGLGSDFPLKRTLSRMLLIFYAPFGIIMIGLLVRSVRGLVVERAKEKVSMRRLGKERDRWTDSINMRLQGKEEEQLELIDSRPRSLLFYWHYRRQKKFQQLPRVIAHARSEQLEHNGKWHHAEFELMRYIQITLERSERYVALVVSLLAFFIVWIGGSLVFWALEHKDQQWTCTESLYFTYTTLLTIGYGDFFPTSSAGKPFFVIWSLIAVPTMTVLVGNMGDTVVRALQEMTDWLGKTTRVLPEYQDEYPKEEGRKQEEVKDEQALPDSDRTRESPARASPAPSWSVSRILHTRHYGDLSSISSSGENQAASQLESSSEIRSERGGDPFPCRKSQQSTQEESSRNSASRIQAEAAFLAHEISKLTKDVYQQPPKKYEWEEWATWLKILGDEVALELEEREIEAEEIEVSMSLTETDANPDTQVEQDDHQQHSTPNNLKLRRYRSRANPGTERGAKWHWTWLHDKGPLFSPQTETEWILSRLCRRLEHLMDEFSGHNQ